MMTPDALISQEKNNATVDDKTVRKNVLVTGKNGLARTLPWCH
jgi:hypothetical protein